MATEGRWFVLQNVSFCFIDCFEKASIEMNNTNWCWLWYIHLKQNGMLTHWPYGCRQRSGPTLDQVMACCLTAPSHYLNQCWLINTTVLWHSSEGFIMRRYEDTYKQNKNEILIFKITCRFPMDQCVNCDSFWTNGLPKLTVQFSAEVNR